MSLCLGTDFRFFSLAKEKKIADTIDVSRVVGHLCSSVLVMLPKKSVLNLRRTSKAMNIAVRSYVEDAIPFIRKKGCEFTTMMPKRQSVWFNDIDIQPLVSHNITHITLGHEFNRDLTALPATLTSLTLGHQYNRPLPVELPRGLLRLVFWPTSIFDRAILNLPKALSVLHLGDSFSMHEWLVLPKGLTELYTGARWIEPISNDMLPKLKVLRFGACFNDRVDDLPRSLTHLSFGYAFDGPADRLPEALLHIEFGDSFDHEVDSMPRELITFVTGRMFSRSLDLLPNTVETIRVGYMFNEPVRSLPSSLTTLEFGHTFTHEIEIPFPPWLRSLKFGEWFNSSLPPVPRSLRRLQFGAMYNKPLPIGIEYVKHLAIGSAFKSFPESLPTSITVLDLAGNNHREWTIPANLEEIRAHTDLYIHKSLPKSIKRIILKRKPSRPHPYATVTVDPAL